MWSKRRYFLLFQTLVASSLILSVVQGRGEETLRRKLNEFKLTLSPVESPSITAVLSSQASLGRDHIETYLQEYLQTTSFTDLSSSTSNHIIHVHTVGLTTPQVTVLSSSSPESDGEEDGSDGEQQTDSNDGVVVVELTMSGLVYFTDDSDKSLLPDEDSLLRIVEEGLPPTVLLTIMKPIFPTVTSVQMDTYLPEVTLEPTMAPSVETPPGSTIQPTPSGTVTGLDDNSNNEGDGDGSGFTNNIIETESNGVEASDGFPTGIVIGAVVGGLVIILVAVVFVSSSRKRQSRRQHNDADEMTKDKDVWKTENVVTININGGSTFDDDLDSSPARTERMDDFDEEEQQQHPQHQQHPHLQQPDISDARTPSKQQLKNLPSLLATATADHHNIPKPMKDNDDYDNSKDDDDDVCSSLDFNVDDLLTISDYDDLTLSTVNTGSHNMTHPLEPVESFERVHGQRHIVKKDMLIGVDGGPWGNQSNNKSSNNGLYNTPTDEYNCALQPTDVSAATLAIKIRPDKENDNTTTPTKGSKSMMTKNLIPKMSWWGKNHHNNTNHDDDIPQQHHQNRNNKHDDALSSDGGSSFGGGGDWDPDDISEGAPSSDDGGSGAVFSSVSVENKDEQSLLHHSLRNESYKMQRLRTPPPSDKDKKSTTRKKTFSTSSGSRGGQVPPSAILGNGMGRKNITRVMTPPPNMLGSDSFSSEEDYHPTY